MKRHSRKGHKEQESRGIGLQTKPAASAKKSNSLSKAVKFFTQGWGAYTIPLILIALYLLLEQLPFSSFLGLACFLSIVYLVFTDVLPTKKESKNISQPLWELAKTIGLAIAAWILICIVLQTGKPMNVVTSCSMLPVLHRGDLVFLQGGQIAAQNVVLNSSIMQSNLEFSQCNVHYLNGSESTAPCLSSLTLNGNQYPAKTQNDIIIYEADPAIYGSIIHRAMLNVTFGNSSYLLTKGDNNPGMDQQSGIKPVSQDRINGKVMLVIPAIGYLKVFLFAGFDFLFRLPTLDFGYALSAFDAPAGCDYLLLQA